MSATRAVGKVAPEGRDRTREVRLRTRRTSCRKRLQRLRTDGGRTPSALGLTKGVAEAVEVRSSAASDQRIRAALAVLYAPDEVERMKNMNE